MSTSIKKVTPLELTSAQQDSEKLLLERLERATNEGEYFRWLLFVVGFYRGLQKFEPAKNLLEQYLEGGGHPQQMAHCYLALGQIATDEGEFEAALTYFVSALELKPEKKKVAYVLHNNAGYCLNMLGRYAEGEQYCRLAIEVNWTRASGYRNLGVSLQGQGDLIGAAWALVEAVKSDMSDDRARALLERLLAEHPRMIVQCPWVGDGLNPTLNMTQDIPRI
jgi:tetratricopeptide (TPR) repeat protein